MSFQADGSVREPRRGTIPTVRPAGHDGAAAPVVRLHPDDIDRLARAGRKVEVNLHNPRGAGVEQMMADATRAANVMRY
jgi:hypothetical protein